MEFLKTAWEAVTTNLWAVIHDYPYSASVLFLAGFVLGAWAL